MSRAYLKTPLARSLPEAIGKGANDALQLAGKCLPCSVVARVSPAVVRVKIELDTAPFTLPQMEVAIFGVEFVRIPLPNGTPGLLIPADAYTGHLTGLGGGVPGLTQPANLGAVQFLPLASTAWSASDPQTLRLYGVNRLIAADSDGGDAVMDLSATEAKLSFGANYLKVTSAGVFINGTFTINGQPYTAHTHFVAAAPGNSAGVNP
jgi:hypothetical protein